jgi:hypothetical protein
MVAGQIHHQFGMPGFRLDSEPSLSVRITDFIPYGGSKSGDGQTLVQEWS